jgi:hypothetical protein
MTKPRHFRGWALFCLALLLFTPAFASAAAYPGNVCVSQKMKLSGNYCRDVLKAWAVWDKTQDGVKRNDKLARAASRLSDKWNKADFRAFNKQVACTQTTVTAAAMKAMIDGVTAGIVSDVNTGLDLGTPAEARCGAKLLIAAANRCRALLVAEGVWVKRLDKDPESEKRNLKRTKAIEKFTLLWGKATASSCPTSATEGATAAALDALHAVAVRDTTISPVVSDTSFDQIPGDTVVYEKRQLNPTCAWNTPYSFFAKRGTVNKVLMYYQGGGACWDYSTCEVFRPFDQDVDPGSAGDNPNLGVRVGFDDITNPDNPFRDWHIVFVPYCSGDVHLGDAEATYFDGPDSVTIQHRGFINAKSAEKWAREHFVNPEQVFITGSSAGAYGALLHGTWLQRVWPASDINVLGDAGNGVITEDFRADNFPSWNVDANLPPDIPGLVELTVPSTTALAANFYPRSKWAHYTTAFDGSLGGQTGFYNIMLNPGNIGAWLSWWNGSCEWNSIMRAQAIDTHAAAPDNYRYYIGTGSRHTIWGSSRVYTETTGGVPPLVDWINAMLDDTPAWTNVEATNQGLLLSGDPSPDPLQAPFQQVGPDVVIDCP